MVRTVRLIVALALLVGYVYGYVWFMLLEPDVIGNMPLQRLIGYLLLNVGLLTLSVLLLLID